jgi:cytidylate kinase
MGTVVFPDAVLKVFLTASVQVRAERRYKQLNGKGIRANLASLSRDLAMRDERDANRAVAPLVPAAGAIQLDSSDLSVEEVVAQVVQQARGKIGSS